MAKSIYGYKDVFSPEHTYMAPTQKAAFKFLIKNTNYETCIVGSNSYSINRKTKSELIKEYLDRIDKLKSYQGTGKIAKLCFGYNAKMYEDKISVLKDCPLDSFVCFEGRVFFQTN